MGPAKPITRSEAIVNNVVNFIRALSSLERRTQIIAIGIFAGLSTVTAILLSCYKKFHHKATAPTPPEQISKSSAQDTIFNNLRLMELLRNGGEDEVPPPLPPRPQAQKNNKVPRGETQAGTEEMKSVPKQDAPPKSPSRPNPEETGNVPRWWTLRNRRFRKKRVEELPTIVEEQPPILERKLDVVPHNDPLLEAVKTGSHCEDGSPILFQLNAKNDIGLYWEIFKTAVGNNPNLLNSRDGNGMTFMQLVDKNPVSHEEPKYNLRSLIEDVTQLEDFHALFSIIKDVPLHRLDPAVKDVLARVPENKRKEYIQKMLPQILDTLNRRLRMSGELIAFTQLREVIHFLKTYVELDLTAHPELLCCTCPDLPLKDIPACLFHYGEFVGSLLSKYTFENWRSPSGQNILHILAEIKEPSWHLAHEAILKTFIVTNPWLIVEENNEGIIPFEIAAQNQSFQQSNSRLSVPSPTRWFFDSLKRKKYTIPLIRAKRLCDIYAESWSLDEMYELSLNSKEPNLTFYYVLDLLNKTAKNAPPAPALLADVQYKLIHFIKITKSVYLIREDKRYSSLKELIEKSNPQSGFGTRTAFGAL